MSCLSDSLVELAGSDMYPFHMPGHKRNMPGHRLEAAYRMDITEITDFDNLHCPKGLIKQAQERAARLWGAKESFFLVNGSTAGILAALSVAFPKRSELILDRNCHKAAYHGVLLRELKAHYLYPDLIEEGFFHSSVSKEQVEELYKKYPESKGVFLTSPDYNGVVSPIEEIADVVHKHEGILIVDQAHGAHFGFSGEFPESAVTKGADIVIQSLHKTLPSFTQTALLCLCSERIDKSKMQSYLEIYQTSSPSYLFMSTMEECVALLEQEGEQLFSSLSDNIDEFLNDVKNLRHLKVLNREFAKERGFYQFDKSKLIISTYGTGLSGKELSDRLHEQHHLEMEMACEHYVLALTSICDRREGFQRLANALLEIDEQLNCSAFMDKAKGLDIFFANREAALTLGEAEEMEKERISLYHCRNRISGEFIYLYPPGVPLIVPGEHITLEMLEQIASYKKQGFTVIGLKGKEEDHLEVIK